MANATPANIDAAYITMRTEANGPGCELLGLHAMTWKRDPTTGESIKYENLEAPIPGTAPEAAAPADVYAMLPGTKLDERTINAIYRAILRHTWAGLAAGDRVLWPGFATFYRVWIPPRPGRNPRTGDYLTVPGHWRIKVDRSKKLFLALNRPKRT